MKKEKKTIIITSIAILTLLACVIGAAYAYFVANTGTGANININANTATTDLLTFDAGAPISITATLENFSQGKANRVGATTATATLIPSNATNQATATYNVFFIIDDNEFTYSTETKEAELILKITDPKDNLITNITGLDKVGNGFDITENFGTIQIAKDYVIEANDADGKTDTWNVEVILVNLDANQNANLSKSLFGRVFITSSSEPDYDLAQMNTIDIEKTQNSITINAVTTSGTEEIDKYYFAIEEKSGIAAIRPKVVGVSNTLAIAKDKYIESEVPEYTFNNLKKDATYTIYTYTTDKKGFRSNVNKTEVITDEYDLPKITGVTYETTKDSIKVTAEAEKGTNDIANYYFSKDNGKTWSEGGTSNDYTFSSLEAGNYKIMLKVEDTNGKASPLYYKELKIASEAQGVPTLAFHETCNDNTIACQIAKKVATDDTLYYHTSSLANGASDNSYRYAGADPNNYVCFGSTATTCPEDNLYRIIGVFGSQVKLIKSTVASAALIGTNGNYYGSDDYYFYWNATADDAGAESNNWDESELNTINLNTNFINNIGSTWGNLIATTTWYVGGMSMVNGQQTNAKTAYNYELGASKTNTTYNAKIGLIYVSEYYYAASPEFWTLPGWEYMGKGNDYRKAKAANWLCLDSNELTITRAADDTTDVFAVGLDGVVASISVDSSTGARPSFSLLSSVKLESGSGTSTDPYRIS